MSAKFLAEMAAFSFAPAQLFIRTMWRWCEWWIARKDLYLTQIWLGKVAKKKNRKKCGHLPTPPRTPPPAPLVGLFGEIFRWKFFSFIFLMENQSVMPETDFKQKKNWLFFLTDHYLPKSRWSIKSKEKPLKFNFQSYFNGFRSDIDTPYQV